MQVADARYPPFVFLSSKPVMVVVVVVVMVMVMVIVIVVVVKVYEKDFLALQPGSM